MGRGQASQNKTAYSPGGGSVVDGVIDNNPAPDRFRPGIARFKTGDQPPNWAVYNK